MIGVRVSAICAAVMLFVVCMIVLLLYLMKSVIFFVELFLLYVKFVI